MFYIVECLVLYYTIILEIQIGQIWDSQRVNMDEKRAFAGVGNRWCGCSTHYNTRTSSATPTAWGFEDGCWWEPNGWFFCEMLKGIGRGLNK